MPALSVQCPHCARSYSVDGSLIGRKARCKNCGNSFALTPSGEIAVQAPGSGDAQASGPLSSSWSSTIPLPEKIGRFLIKERLGAGACGAVYRALDPTLDRDVALKVPHPEFQRDEKAVSRFLREAKTAAKLHHPHIVTLYEAGTDGETSYIASAYISGRSLADAIDDGPFEPRRAARIVGALADALHAAHQQGIVHRDVKPANILLDAEDRPHLTDFGLARLAASSVKLTKVGSILGTPAYLAPEQARGKSDEAEPASDQYSLGVTLYELLCGQVPFAGPLEVVIFHTLNTPPPPLREENPEIPVELEAICLKALSKKPEERYSSCREMAKDLGRWLAGRTTSLETPAIREQPNTIMLEECRPVPSLGSTERESPALAPTVRDERVQAARRPLQSDERTVPSRRRLAPRPWMIAAAVAAVLLPLLGIVVYVNELVPKVKSPSTPVAGSAEKRMEPTSPAAVAATQPTPPVTTVAGDTHPRTISLVPPATPAGAPVSRSDKDASVPDETRPPPGERVYDIAADWSDSRNPNGPWSYNASPGKPLKNHVEDLDPARTRPGFKSAQPAFAFHDNASRWHIPFFLKVIADSNNPGIDIPQGRFYMHNNDPDSSPAGLGESPSGFTWTSPYDGNAQISGGAWIVHRAWGRSEKWSIKLNGKVVTSGLLTASPEFTSSTPQNLAAGTGGPASLNFMIRANDVISYQVVLAPGVRWGSLMGVDFKIKVAQSWQGVDPQRAAERTAQNGLSKGPIDPNGPAELAAGATVSEPGFIPLYTGGDPLRQGWKMYGYGSITEESDGVLVTKSGNGLLCYAERIFNDFTLRLDYRTAVAGDNSGVYFGIPRLPITPEDAAKEAHEVQIWDVGDNAQRTGAIWGKKGPDRSPPSKSPGEWNRLELTLRGGHCEVSINGVPVNEYLATTGLAGYLGLQNWKTNGVDSTVRFRNIRIKPLTAADGRAGDERNPSINDAKPGIVSRSFFNGKNLTGWEGMKGYWQVRDGAIIGSCPPGRPAHTFLCSKQSYGDFELRFKVRLREGVGNSGVQFRSWIVDRKGFRARGPQCEIVDPSRDHPAGSLVTEPAGPAIAAPREQVTKVYKADDFNDYSIKCVNKHVTIQLNGLTTVDGEFPSMPDQGIIAWQIHGRDTPREVVFKDITLLELTDRRR